MKKIQTIILLLLAIVTGVSAQSIRKNHLEMTQSEKDELVDAFYQLKSSPNLIDDIATFYDNNYYDIHANGTSDDVFLAWYRRLLFEMEQSMQDINPNLSIPFWDWTTDQSTSSVLWDYDFLGQFNSDWGLGRSLGSHDLPTSADVATLQANTNWYYYTTFFEFEEVHTAPHNWVEGFMGEIYEGGRSPIDPAFYLHHCMMDKIWQEWVETNNITSSSNLYVKTTMPRYDGTYTFNGQTLPSVNPDNIVDSKVLGVFYAENQLAELVDYSVSNTYNSEECFYYQYKIEAKNDFVIPNSKKAKIESQTQVVLLPGFVANNGAVFLAKIDTDNNINSSIRQGSTVSIQNQGEVLEVFPNPTTDGIQVKLQNKCFNCELSILNSQGETLFMEKMNEKQNLTMDLNGLREGLYFLKLQDGNNIVMTKKITKL